MVVNRNGQSTVEYIFLLAAISVIMLKIVGSDAYQRFLGKDGELFVRYKDYLEHTYRHSYNGDGDATGTYDDYTGLHDSYTQGGWADTRFFLVKEPYGR